MLKRFRIDSLLLFLVLGLVFLWLLFPDIKENLFGTQRCIVQELSFEEQLKYPRQGMIKDGEIRAFNPALDLHYSIDGGKTFVSAPNNQLTISELRNPELIYLSTSIRWRHPKGDFPQLKNVQVKLLNAQEKRESQVKNLTFFTEPLDNYPVINITANQDDLFSWCRGIMIYGSASMEEEGFQKDWWYRSANFANRGKEWGRKVHFQYFENNELRVEKSCEMRISGNATRYFPQKSLKLFPLDEAGRPTKIAYDFFQGEGNKKAESLLLRQSGNDNQKTLFADLLMHQLAAESNVLVQHGFPVSVFLNGNYWGIYNLRERIDPYFIAKKEKVSKKEVTVLYCEVYGDRTLLKSGDDSDKQNFDSLIAALPKDLPLNDEAYESLKTQISIKSFIDYIIFETFYGNQDWLYNNTTWYKAEDKKWKWLLNDLDYSLAYPGENNLNANLFEKLKKSQSITAQLFNALISYPKFLKRFKDRAQEIIETNFSNENIETQFSTLKNVYAEQIDLQIRRWRFIDSKATWEKDCQKNVTFLRERRTLFLKQVDNL